MHIFLLATILLFALFNIADETSTQDENGSTMHNLLNRSLKISMLNRELRKRLLNETREQGAKLFTSRKAKKCIESIDSTITSSNRRIWKVYGLFNSGTNYMWDLLYKNGFDVGMMGIPDCDGVELNVCTRDYRGWKHADPNTFTHKYLSPLNRNIMPVIVVRNPFSWMLSTKKLPYSLKKCIGEKIRCDYTWDKICEIGHTDMWSNYTSFELLWGEHYWRMLQQIPLVDGVYVRYEDLTFYPERILKQLQIRSKLMNITCIGPCMSGEWNLTETDSRTWIRRNNHANTFAKKKILDKNYLKFLKKQTVENLCNHNETRFILEMFEYIDDCTNKL